MIKKHVKNILPTNIVEKISRTLIRLKGLIYANKLNKLAELHNCDKWGTHFYTEHYQHYFKRFKNKKINLLEIGVGGYKSPNRGGSSLRMWKDYFRKANIYGLDLYDKSLLEEKRIKIFKGDQSDTNLLRDVFNKIGDVDIIIDDGSHINEHIIVTFKYLYPLLKKGGIYVVEDLQTSYWSSYGGSSKNLNMDGTAMNYFKKLVDGINHKEFMIDDYKDSYFDKHIISMHFYHNMVFIQKGDNNEMSNYLVNNKIPKNG